MDSQPRGDTAQSAAWQSLLAHRPKGEVRDAAAVRLAESGVTPAQLEAVLRDGGDELFNRALACSDDWADPFGGMLAAALLAAEVSAMAAHLNSRASAVRALAVDALLDDYSAVAVAARLGVSRQKVYDISRGSLAASFIDHVPWRESWSH